MDIKIVKNKYGKVIFLPPTHDTAIERKTEEILLELGATYEKQFAFDESGLRRIKFDFALMKNAIPALFIECDGESHYSPEYYLSMGNRSERNMAHVTKTLLSDATKDRLANEKGIPLLRINSTHKEIIQEY